MARPSVLHDKKIYQEIIRNLALGVPQVLIAQSMGIHEATLSNWKKRRDFKRDLALKLVELGNQPIEKVRKSQPLAWLERHPEFREQWAPPKIIDQKLAVNTILVELPERLQYEVIDVDVPRLSCDVGE